MCWGIFPFLVPCLSHGVIWADGEQPIRARHVSNRSSWSIKGPSFRCSGSPPPQKLIIYLSRCIKALLQKDPSLSCVCVFLPARFRDTGTHDISKYSVLFMYFFDLIFLSCQIFLLAFNRYMNDLFQRPGLRSMD